LSLEPTQGARVGQNLQRSRKSHYLAILSTTIIQIFDRSAKWLGAAATPSNGPIDTKKFSSLAALPKRVSQGRTKAALQSEGSGATAEPCSGMAAPERRGPLPQQLDAAGCALQVAAQNKAILR
jgi:hypothetical protein